MPCEYCGGRAVHDDHVLPQSLVGNYNADRVIFPEKPPIPEEWLDTVPACLACNLTKFTFRLVPPSWQERIPELDAFFGGRPGWRVYAGGPL